jgi:hypothetical protein
MDEITLPIDIGYYQTRGGTSRLIIDGALPTWLLGKTRTGKSQGLLTAFRATVLAGHGCLLADPHGPLADGALHHIPEPRLKDVIIFDPTKRKVPGVGFFHPDKAALSVEWFLNIIELLSGKFWGPQTAEILLAICLALLEQFHKPTILHVYKALARPAFCETLWRRSKNPIVKDMYAKWFSKDIPVKNRLEAFSHPLNKVLVFLRDDIREILCQENVVNWCELMDQKKIVIVRLPKGEIGETAARIIGSLIIFNIILAAPQRLTADHWPLIMDEVQTFLDCIPFSLLLAELAKNHITPIFANQAIQQLRDEDRKIKNDLIALGTVSNLLAFRVSGDDAEAVAKFAGIHDSESLVNLHNYTFAAATTVNQVPTFHLPVNTYSKLPRQGTAPYENVLAWAIENNGTEKEEVHKYIQAELA